MKYEIIDEGAVTILSLGEKRLIYESLDPIQQTFIQLVDEGKTRIVLDMEQVEYLDSFAVGFIMDMYRRVTNVGGKMKISGLQPRVKKVLAITRVDSVIDIYPEKGEAVSAFTANG